MRTKHCYFEEDTFFKLKKPSWNDAPTWADYLGVMTNEDGTSEWYWFGSAGIGPGPEEARYVEERPIT